MEEKIQNIKKYAESIIPQFLEGWGRFSISEKRQFFNTIHVMNSFEIWLLGFFSVDGLSAREQSKIKTCWKELYKTEKNPVSLRDDMFVISKKILNMHVDFVFANSTLEERKKNYKNLSESDMYISYFFGFAVGLFPEEEKKKLLLGFKEVFILATSVENMNKILYSVLLG